jgi:ecdysteroid kinase
VDEAPARPLPVEIGEISKDWLTAALRTHAPDIEVRDFELLDMMRSTCTKIVILKGGFEPHSRHLHYIHEKEARAYAELLPVLGLRHPKAYFAEYDAERKQGIVIMDDLVARGVTFCNPLQPHSFEQVVRRLSELARYHAGSWNSPEFRPENRWDWVEDVPLNMLHYFGEYLQGDVWERYIGSPRGAAASVRFHNLAWMRDALDRIAALSATLPHCVNHGDTHLGNLYVDVDGTPGFYDALAGRAPAMLEIAYHLGCALDVADRPRWEEALIRHYLDELKKAGVDAPPFEEAMRQYATFLAFGYCIFIINEAVFQSEAVNTAYTARFSAAMLDHDTIGRLNEVKI